MQSLIIKIKNFSAGFFGKMKKKSFLVFWIILAIILAFEVFMVKDVLLIIIKPAGEPLIVNKKQQVKLNFEGYNYVIEKINAAKNFKAEIKPINSPFGVK